MIVNIINHGTKLMNSHIDNGRPTLNIPTLTNVLFILQSEFSV